MILFVSFHFIFVFSSAGGSVQMGSVLEPHSDENKARQRGCDLGTAGEKLWERTTVGRRYRGGRGERERRGGGGKSGERVGWYSC